jgi:hypothetical protein
VYKQCFKNFDYYIIFKSNYVKNLHVFGGFFIFIFILFLTLRKYQRGRSNALRRLKPYEETEVKIVRPISNQHKLLCEMYAKRKERERRRDERSREE